MSNHGIGHALCSEVVSKVLELLDTGRIGLKEAKELIWSCCRAANCEDGNTYEVLEATDERCGVCLKPFPEEELVFADWDAPEDGDTDASFVAKHAYSEKILGQAVCKNCLAKLKENKPIDNKPSMAVPAKHAHWVKIRVTQRTVQYKCSACGHWEEKEYPYCNCGAQMDLEETHEVCT